MKTFKTTVLLALSALLLWQCKPSTKQQDKMYEHDAGPVTLTLDNGAKWKTDSITLIHVGEIKTILNNDRPVSAEDFTNSAQKIDAVIVNLLNDCRMQGPAHDALHHWLEPLLETNKKLLETKSAEAAAPLWETEKQHLGIFTNYFE